MKYEGRSGPAAGLGIKTECRDSTRPPFPSQAQRCSDSYSIPSTRCPFPLSQSRCQPHTALRPAHHTPPLSPTWYASAWDVHTGGPCSPSSPSQAASQPKPAAPAATVAHPWLYDSWQSVADQLRGGLGVRECLREALRCHTGDRFPSVTSPSASPSPARDMYRSTGSVRYVPLRLQSFRPEAANRFVPSCLPQKSAS